MQLKVRLSQPLVSVPFVLRSRFCSCKAYDFIFTTRGAAHDVWGGGHQKYGAATDYACEFGVVAQDPHEDALGGRVKGDERDVVNRSSLQIV